ncbi:MerR family transcriptional regulator [Actinomadura sp. HBU206391]|uniref:MerR family transcriptional regulator n=1 Tax=Actinomadura sp. HBU206391 TaxID=2731692 RepID=UPI0016506516|nr:MerR family transcriptional regulator [Actinomadura sp. HBU206391]MBC6460314.1 MerR family transcriptional regulator [Actinomadura sp. HBU206391]
MLIGELAAEAGTTTRALRYYEEQGLLEPGRTAAGYRVYEPGAVRRVRNIRELLATGFTVEDVKSFLGYLDADLPEVFCHSARCADGFVVGAQRVADLEERITTLIRLRDSLVHKMPWLAPSEAGAVEPSAEP